MILNERRGMQAEAREPEALLFEDAGEIPNSTLPLLLYRAENPSQGEAAAVWLEETFAANDWTNSWRNGVYPYHHYHSNTHEVLGVYRGSALLHLGGESGREIEVQAGDVIVIPAGTGHKRIMATADFSVVGAYPEGKEPDLHRDRIPDVEQHIAGVPLPTADPVRGSFGGLKKIWNTGA